MEPSIRRMTIQDVATVHAINEAVTIGAWSEKLFADCIAVGYECWVLVKNDEVIGFCVMNYAANEAHILSISVHLDYQRQGLGQQLLNHLLALAKANGADDIFLEVRSSNTGAINLYKKNNFVEVGVRKDYYPAEDDYPSEDAITMAAPL